MNLKLLATAAAIATLAATAAQAQTQTQPSQRMQPSKSMQQGGSHAPAGRAGTAPSGTFGSSATHYGSRSGKAVKPAPGGSVEHNSPATGSGGAAGGMSR